MKRYVSLLAFLFLVGCGGETAPVGYVPAQTATALLESGGFDQVLDSLDTDILADYYGLESVPTDGVIYTSMEGGYEEIAVLTFETSEDATAALDVMAQYVSDRADLESQLQYKPEDLPKLENALLSQVEHTVLLVVATDYDAVNSALDTLSN